MSIAVILFACFGIQNDSLSPWPYQHIDNTQLSNSAITSVYMDRIDHLWLGTWDGLNRYDGSSMEVYKPDPFIPGSISNNVIRGFLEDGNGSLWVVTHQGINKYNRTKNSFQIYLDSLTDVPFLEYNIRASIGPDSAVWVNVLGKGISRYSAEQDEFISVPFAGISPSWHKSIVDLGHHNGLQYLLGSDGRLACSVNDKLIFQKQLTDQTFSFNKFLRLGQKYFLALIVDRQLLLFDLSELEKEPNKIKLDDVLVSSLSENLEHTAIWVGSESGEIFKISHGPNGFVAKSMNSFFPAFSKDRIKILSIQETKQEIIWIGTDGDGVYKFLTKPKIFYSVTEGETGQGQLSHKIIRSIYEDKKGTLYIGTRGGGLNIIDPVSGKTSVLSSSNGLSNNAVLSINKDHQDNIWVGQDGEGIDMIEHGTGKIFHFPRDFENDNDLVFASVYAICVDAFNDIWLGTSGHGVVRLKVLRSSLGRYKLIDSDQFSQSDNSGAVSIKSNIVYAIVEEKPNLLWFGTRGGGIYRYNALTKKIETHIQASTNEKNSLNNNDALSLYIDKQEQLWIGSSGGLHRLFLQTKPYRIEHFTEHEGLPNNTIHAILEDRQNNIWFSTNRGLVLFDRVNSTFKNFNANDGLKNNEFADGAAFQSTTSTKLFFGGIDGLDIVYPEKQLTRNYFPRLTVTGFQVRNVTITPGDESRILNKNIDRTDSLVLHYDQNFISFTFTTLDYWNKQKSEYGYFLENFDKDWNYIGKQQSLTLTNIPPGHYKLLINFTNENGKWSQSPKSISIIVKPPFWKTYWAWAIYILLGLGLQLGIILYIRGRAKTKKILAMGKFKALQLQELNDYKLQFFTNIAHEFRTPLTLILGPAATLLNSNQTSEDQQQLKAIYDNSLRMQKLIDELILFRKIESGKDGLEISSVDLVSFIHEIVEPFQQFAADREINLEFHPEPESWLAYVDQKKIEKIMINLISNAIKYSPKGGMVSVVIKASNGHALLLVKDEGHGIKPENSSKIFESFYHNPEELPGTNGIEKSTGIGLSLTKSLVHSHRGTIEVESKIGAGTTFTVTLPISKEHYRDVPIRSQDFVPSAPLPEKISMEFETDHFQSLATNALSVRQKKPNLYSILLVDDSDNILSFLESLLVNQYAIHKARNGIKALDILERERIDLVVTDVIMPDMDGLTLCKKIKDNIQSSHIPVILLTAKGEIENRIEGLQVGADSYIPKPFHPDHLFVRIEKLIERMEQVRKKFLESAKEGSHPFSTGISDRDDNFFSKLTACIQLHLGNPEFNADVIALEVGMSKASLYKKVKTITGLTPHGLVKQFRLKKAADLLKQSDLSISDVIYETGFSSRSYFYKSFNEMYHCHPKDVEQAAKVEIK
jgi:signal transduction histidine kinase/DNA-binding response OmpR family regulator/ligand-binding sensor domain-containing protein